MTEQLDYEMRPPMPVAGPLQFGSAFRVASGNAATPGAFSLTWIDVRSDQEAEEVRMTAAAVAAELAEQPGFLSWIGMEIGRRLYTITAWENADAVRAVTRSSTHRAIVKRFFAEDLGAAIGTGVWSAHHLNPVRVRCSSCAQWTIPGGDGACACGQPLPQPPPYW